MEKVTELTVRIAELEAERDEFKANRDEWWAEASRLAERCRELEDALREVASVLSFHLHSRPPRSARGKAYERAFNVALNALAPPSQE